MDSIPFFLSGCQFHPPDEAKLLSPEFVQDFYGSFAPNPPDQLNLNVQCMQQLYSTVDSIYCILEYIIHGVTGETPQFQQFLPPAFGLLGQLLNHHYAEISKNGALYLSITSSLLNTMEQLSADYSSFKKLMQCYYKFTILHQVPEYLSIFESNINRLLDSSNLPNYTLQHFVTALMIYKYAFAIHRNKYITNNLSLKIVSCVDRFFTSNSINLENLKIFSICTSHAYQDFFILMNEMHKYDFLEIAINAASQLPSLEIDENRKQKLAKALIMLITNYFGDHQIKYLFPNRESKLNKLDRLIRISPLYAQIDYNFCAAPIISTLALKIDFLINSGYIHDNLNSFTDILFFYCKLSDNDKEDFETNPIIVYTCYEFNDSDSFSTRSHVNKIMEKLCSIPEFIDISLNKLAATGPTEESMIFFALLLENLYYINKTAVKNLPPQVHDLALTFLAVDPPNPFHLLANYYLLQAAVPLLHSHEEYQIALQKATNAISVDCDNFPSNCLLFTLGCKLLCSLVNKTEIPFTNSELISIVASKKDYCISKDALSFISQNILNTQSIDTIFDYFRSLIEGNVPLIIYLKENETNCSSQEYKDGVKKLGDSIDVISNILDMIPAFISNYESALLEFIQKFHVLNEDEFTFSDETVNLFKVIFHKCENLNQWTGFYLHNIIGHLSDAFVYSEWIEPFVSIISNQPERINDAILIDLLKTVEQTIINSDDDDDYFEDLACFCSLFLRILQFKKVNPKLIRYMNQRMNRCVESKTQSLALYTNLYLLLHYLYCGMQLKEELINTRLLSALQKGLIVSDNMRYMLVVVTEMVIKVKYPNAYANIVNLVGSCLNNTNTKNLDFQSEYNGFSTYLLDSVPFPIIKIHPLENFVFDDFSFNN
ncbi:hypothetical protein TRFO_31001 [Tritrichomonas foetus]|uniref:Uncharacterized protein n=1 Tax=Tritrichomonas foetus TaxID=1144522 RepID=A0A1J4JTC0_9EUKA|nr:hypothetical protein TRFO_31001 [Tritrichomonas foetus]|eukprot:OHT01986.1 hypothetical protein TRFO_31001 [Tritrichomonas foetus]